MSTDSDPTTDAEDRPTTGTSDQLVVENVVTGYGNHEIIHDVSAKSHEGVTCIFGPNGSGKSTLIKAMGGKLPLWSGRKRMGDRDLTDANASDMVDAGVITVPQDGGLFPSMTVRENLLMGGHSVDDDDLVSRRMDEAYEAFPILEEKTAAKATSLSGGQQMMLSFARAMVSGADVFLLDEPSAGLAPTLVDDVMEQVRTLVDRGVQVVLVEQNVKTALRVADHVYILAQGRTQFDGPPADLAEEDELIELYLGIK
ncbi:ABC transporter ATP-binding protein [Halomarina salina]|uniref:ABC transporter ATP-binding protein n=1 Tax=Halomarina salina TaxID=1872699 RepID=A0ABD5RNI4_9EURY|nr:ABC transporter ATP-binding protein [Halomarina salina]